MKLFNIFRKRRREPEHEDGALFYHEDDYCQVELSPIENLPLFHKESEEINDLAEKSFDGHGFTDIYVRSDNRIGLEARKINPFELEHIIAQIGLDKAKKVCTGYGLTYRETRKDTIGFGKNYSAIYFDVKDEVVNHVWMTNHFDIEKKKLIECLVHVGKKWSLLLMDWNQPLSVDLSNKNEVVKYVMEVRIKEELILEFLQQNGGKAYYIRIRDAVGGRFENENDFDTVLHELCEKGNIYENDPGDTLYVLTLDAPHG